MNHYLHVSIQYKDRDVGSYDWYSMSSIEYDFGGLGYCSHHGRWRCRGIGLVGFGGLGRWIMGVFGWLGDRFVWGLICLYDSVICLGGLCSLLFDLWSSWSWFFLCENWCVWKPYAIILYNQILQFLRARILGRFLYFGKLRYSS